ncbi:MAG: hypothetical protein ACP5MD_12170, partial [Verrucomicrobiia bacterium]
ARQLWRGNLAVLGLWAALSAAATIAIYGRAWELLMPLEPRHGPAQIDPLGRVQICSVDMHSPSPLVGILLPDGRIWAGNIFAALSGEFRPVGGEFIAGTNWTALASTRDRAVAIRADGTLWRVFEQTNSWMFGNEVIARLEAPQRIGTDSDWVSLSADSEHFLGLKKDGSIWGWGGNTCGQLGGHPAKFADHPVRIGDESDWADVFASMSSSAALKKDGTLWVWGSIAIRDAPGISRPARLLAPVKFNLPGANLVQFKQGRLADLALYGDGSAFKITQTHPQPLPGGAAFEDRGGKTGLAGSISSMDASIEHCGS